MYSKHHQHHHYTHDNHSFEISSDHSTIFLFFYLLLLFLVILRPFLARLEGKVILLLFQLGSNLWEHPAFSARFMYQEKTASFFCGVFNQSWKTEYYLEGYKEVNSLNFRQVNYENKVHVDQRLWNSRRSRTFQEFVRALKENLKISHGFQKECKYLQKCQYLLEMS